MDWTAGLCAATVQPGENLRSHRRADGLAADRRLPQSLLEL